MMSFRIRIVRVLALVHLDKLESMHKLVGIMSEKTMWVPLISPLVDRPFLTNIYVALQNSKIKETTLTHKRVSIL